MEKYFFVSVWKQKGQHSIGGEYRKQISHIQSQQRERHITWFPRKNYNKIQ